MSAVADVRALAESLTAEGRLERLGTELPELAAIGRYVPYRLVGNMLYVSGSSARPRYQTFPTAPKHVPTAQKNTGSCC